MAISHKGFDFSQLSPAERIMLAQNLLDSVLAESHSPLTPQQIAELRRRAAAIDSGEDKGVPWEQVRAILQPRA